MHTHDDLIIEDLLQEYLAKRGKAELISKAKTEDFIRSAIKAASYIKGSYIRDLDNNIIIDIPKKKRFRIGNEYVDYLFETMDSKDKSKSKRYKK